YQIHTGLQHSIIRPRQPSCLPPHLHTLPQRLQEAGYATHLLGKWHLGFYSYGSCDGPGLCGYDLHDNEGVAWGQQGRYSTLLYTQRARKILETHDPAAQPLFLMLSLQAVHTPLQPPKSYIYPYRHMYNVARRKYAAMVSTVDEAVHNVTYALRKLGYYRNTVLVFSTDNGAQPFTGGSNWPLRGRKGTYWEGGVRGVAFVHSPLLKRRRRVSKALLHITDWFPTLLGLAGVNVSQKVNRLPAAKTVKKKTKKTRKSKTKKKKKSPPTQRPGEPTRDPRGSKPLPTKHKLKSKLQGGSKAQPVATATLQWSQHIWDTSIQAAIRVGDWKLLTGDPGHGDWVPPQMLSSLPGRWWNLERTSTTFSSSSSSSSSKPASQQNIWLFNISADPYERWDVSAQRPDVVQALLERLAFHNRTAVPVFFPPDDPRADPALHGGAWVPWVEEEEGEEGRGVEEEQEKYRGVYKQRKRKRKKPTKKKQISKLN
ncbi:hypothetical protein CRUP_019722, partial [Coryphaenoides rupestris]